jgi:hypothetical protein
MKQLFVLVALASLGVVLGQGNTSTDGCALCCSPGGSCGAAFKTQPGLCCGVLAEKPFCCPNSAICYLATADTYRCRARPVRPVPNNGYYHRTGASAAWWALWALVIPFLCISYIVYALCRSRSSSYAYPSGSSVAMVPMQGGACAPGGTATGYPQPGYPQYQTAVPLYQPAQMQSGGGMGNAALAGGAGLLGGVLLGESLASRGGGWGGGYGGGWGGPWGGGYGGGFGGGDFAASSDLGGGGDFAADT